MQHIVDVALPGAPHLLAHAGPQRIDIAVGQGGKRPGTIFGQIGYLALTGNDILPESGLVIQEIFYLLHVAGTLGPSLEDTRHGTGAMFVRVSVAGSDDCGGIVGIVCERGVRPLLCISLRHTVGIEQIAHAHDVLVAVMSLVGNAFLL